ncbi:MAG: D-tyrosyl-tRNA(Tyr) deacylase [Magnetococcales bacterium]|nr:D-tyrosyl-tRNA(Tyr) deacylase [Magnetococcales bacterium]
MKGLVQRVSRAQVDVGGETIARIDRGLLVFVAVVRGDGEPELERMVRKVGGLRIFPDEQGRMNRSVKEIGGEILAVSQFTLAAELSRGYRPSFGPAEEPEQAEKMFDRFVAGLRGMDIPVFCGEFGADMQVGLTNDGPVTIWLDYPPKK